MVAHLSLAADAYTDRLARGLASDTSPSEGLPPAGSVNAGSWSEFGAARVISFREGVRGDLLSQFRKANERFHGLLSKLEAAEWETFCYHPGKLVPANTLARFMILELSVLGCDIRSKLAPPAHLFTELLPEIVILFSEYLEWFFEPGHRLDPPHRYRFDIDGIQPRLRDIVVEGDRAQMEVAASGPADASFDCSVETFILLMCGRTSVASAVSAGEMTVKSGAVDGYEFSDWFRGA